MTNAELLKLFNETYPEVAVSDYRPLSLEFIKDKEGITIWTENGDIIQWFPDKMAIEALSCSEEPNRSDTIYRQDAIDAVMKFMPSLTTPDGCGQFDREIFEAQEMFVDIGQALNDLPSVQTERKKGEWTKDCACGICGFKPWYERDIHTLSFCPNCGADMRGGENG